MDSPRRHGRIARLVRALGLAVCAVLAAGASRAHAQDLPYTNHLVGDRALGLSGAFVGLAYDASATFHNPSGLALLPAASISASFWVVAHERREVRDAWRTVHGIATLGDDKLSAPPLAITAVAKLGRRDSLGRRNHAVGLAILKPHKLSYEFDAALSSSGAETLSTLDVIHSDQARWYGASYGYAWPSRRFSVGVTGFFVLRTMNHREVEIHVGDDTALPEARPLTRHSVFDASLRYSVWRLGAMWNPSPRWRLGVMFQPPGWELGGDASNREVTVDIVDGDGAVRNSVHEGLGVRRPIPWELRFGGTYRFRPRALVTVDVSVHGGAGDSDRPVALISERGDVPAPRMLAMETHLGPSVRAAAGTEVLLANKFPVRGGVLLSRSGLPDVPRASEAFAATDINTIGGSLSAGIIMAGGHELSFGATATYGWGDASALDQAAFGQARYVATPATEATVIVFVSGGKRAVKRLAKQVLNTGKQVFDSGREWLR